MKIFSLLVGVYSFNLYLINDAKHLYMADLHSDVLQNVRLKIFAHLKKLGYILLLSLKSFLCIVPNFSLIIFFKSRAEIECFILMY